MTQAKEHLLFIGFGDIAQRISRHANTHYTMSGFKRSAIRCDDVDILLGDCSHSEDLNTLFAQDKSNADVIVITLTPSTISEEGYRKAYLETSQAIIAALDAQNHQPRLIVFVSSTSVYGQKKGEWVDETTPTEPSSFSGKILLATESLWQQSRYASCIVRLSGIYGPGRRRLIEQVQHGQGTAAKPVLYSNRIHADDAAAAIFHLIEQSRHSAIEPLYLVSDSEPVPLHEVKQWLAQAMKLPTDHLTTQTTGRSFRGSKRCSNTRLLDSGFTLRYKSFREGYTALLAHK